MNLVRIGLAGFGNIGSSVFENLKRNASLIESRSGLNLAITAIAEKDIRRKRRVALPKSLHVPNLEALIQRSDIVIELMGGCGAAAELALGALRAGKPVVTANKAMLAVRGREIFSASALHQTPIFFEASVAGGIPVLRAIRESLMVNRFSHIYGIVNGTCNYILTQMAERGVAFADALKEAQELGYAEPDPTFDIEGFDSAHKATVLATLAYNRCVDFKQVYVEGITRISAEDMRCARQLGYAIKLLAIVRRVDDREVEVRVHPTLIPQHNRLVSIRGVTNAVSIRGHVVGDLEFSGPGAGGNATSSAVIGDLIEAARYHLSRRGCNQPPFNAIIHPDGPRVKKMGDVVSRFYLRLAVEDSPGVLAQISSLLGKAKIGIASVIQTEARAGKTVPLILMTHEARNLSMQNALKKISRLKCVKAKPVTFRVETFEN
ncbi:MAG: homoserine dehydrogenase [Verrucomicrobiae bacterium]|nr:homoserine dehydrogenase [Verrucomicrobiae bacterium]